MSKPWFKQRRYGYGWQPASWQGGLVLFIYFAVIGIDILFLLAAKQQADWSDAIRFGAVVIVATGFLVAVAARTGGHPSWNWGKRDRDQ